MKTSQTPKAPETDEQKLDAPLTNRCFLLGLSYLVNTIAALERQELAWPDDLNVRGYATLCATYLRSLEGAAALSDVSENEREMLLRKFNQSLG